MESGGYRGRSGAGEDGYEVASTPLALTRNGDETRELGAALGALVEPGDAIGLVGDLGAGKTCFVQGLALGMGNPAEAYVRSPTFSLIDVHLGGRAPLYHVDLYRLDDPDEAIFIGYDDLFDGRGVVAIEWFDRFEALWPQQFVCVNVASVGPAERQVSARAVGERATTLLRAWIARWAERRA